MNKVDRPAVMELSEDSLTTTMGIMVYFSAIAMSKLDEETGYPTIKNFTAYKLYKNMNDKMDYINQSSMRLGLKRILRQGMVDYNAQGDLLILNSGSGHIKSDENFKSKGYIDLHHFFFNKTFFDLSIGAKRMALILACRLNNNPSKNININFKCKGIDENFEYFSRILKVERLAHIKYFLEELKPFFNISKLKYNTYNFSLNTISKPIVTGTDKLFTFTQEQLEKTEKMVKEANKRNLNFKPKHIRQICEVVCNYNMSFGRKVIKELCKSSRDNVKNFFGYTKAILVRLKTVPL